MTRCHIKIILGSFLLFMGLTTISAGGCAYPGPPDIDQFVPHNKYCNLFYRLDKCPNGLVYNPSKQLCDLPVNTNCGSKQILSENTQGGGNNSGEDGGEENNPPGGNPNSGGRYSFVGGACPSRKTCPQQGNSNQRVFIPHSTICNLFCSCVNGAPLLYRCSSGLHFNPKTSRCENPKQAGCSFDGSSDEEEENSVTAYPPNTETEDWRKPTFVDGVCPPKGKCPQHGVSFLPHETSCNLVCRCKDGKSLLYVCPRGLVYNAVSKLCDYPLNSGCNFGESEEGSGINTNPPPKPTKPTDATHLGGNCLTAIMCPRNIPSGNFVFLPHLLVCNLFCACDGKTIELYSCTKGLHFNPKSQECESPSRAGCKPIPPQEINPILIPNGTGNGDCPTIQPCPANDPTDFTLYLPHQTDCKFFCRCDHGMAKLHKCAQGLHFNPQKQSCDVPNNEVCVTTTSVEERPNVIPTLAPGQVGGNKNNTGSTGDNGSGIIPGDTGIGGQQELCPAEGKCPPGKSDYLPHQRSCDFFCECVNGIPRLGRCPDGLHFNPKTKNCEVQSRALCQGECGKLERRNATIWSPNTCTSRLSQIGDVCSIKCAKGYELRGSAVVTCTKQGWNGTAGLDVLPSCEAPEEVAREIIDNVGQQAKGIANFLFILDESLSLSEEEFDSEISFIKAIVSEFPLSKNRTAGVITFSGSAAVDIHMTHTESCKFFEATDRIMYAGGSTDILLALRTANQEIFMYSPKIKTLVFLITDGKSETNPSSAANDIKRKGHILFTIGVGQYDRKQLEPLASLGNDGVPLFFGLTNFKAFNKIAEYLHTVHGYGANLNCLIPEISV